MAKQKNGALAKAAAKAYDKVKVSSKPGEGERFQALKKAIASRGNVDNPAAVAASIGRKKYGKKKFQAMAAKGFKFDKT